MIPLAKRSPVPLDACNLRKAVDLIGDRWTLLILRAAHFGVRRFDDFHGELGAPRTVLSGRLRKLVDAGLMTQRTYQPAGGRRRSEYVLTEAAHDLRPILVMLMQWGDRYCADGPPQVRFTTQDGAPVAAAFVDPEGRRVDPTGLRTALRR